MLNIRKLKITAALICLFLFLLPSSIFAEADGVSIKWISPEAAYKRISIQTLGESGTVKVTASVDGYYMRVGIADASGNLVVPIAYDDAFYFSEGQYFVRSGNVKKIINAAGEEVFDLSKYDTVKEATYGFSIASLGEKYGLLEKSGRVILPCEYDRVYYNRFGLIWAQKDGVYRFYDENGNVKSETAYSDIASDGYYYEFDELMTVEKDGKYGVVDGYGNEILPCVYTETLVCDNDIIAVLDNGWKYINLNDNSNSYYYEGHLPWKFSDGLAPVYLGEKYGYINKQWQLVIPYKYLNAASFANGMASVCENYEDGYYMIDKSGEAITAPKGYIVVAKGDALIGRYDPYEGKRQWFGPPIYREALLDNDGNRLTKFSYTNISEFENGLAVAMKYGDSWSYGLINRNGEEVTPFIFESMELVEKNTYAVTVSNSDYSDMKAGILTVPDDAAQRKASFERPVSVYMNGLELYFDTEPVIVNGRAMVPMRKIFEAMNCDVSWDAQSKTVTAVKGNVTVELTVGENTAFVNGKAVPLDSPAILENNRTLVPIRFIAEALNLNVDWEPDLRRVNISE